MVQTKILNNMNIGYSRKCVGGRCLAEISGHRSKLEGTVSYLSLGQSRAYSYYFLSRVYELLNSRRKYDKIISSSGFLSKHRRRIFIYLFLS